MSKPLRHMNFSRMSLVCLFAFASIVAGAESVNADDDLVTLVRAGISDDIILAKIRSLPTDKLDASAEAIVALKEAGASEEVLKALVEASSRSGMAASSPLPPSSPGLGGFDRATLITKTGNQTLWADEVVRKARPSRVIKGTFGGASLGWIIEGTRASIRISDRRPQIVLPSGLIPGGDNKAIVRLNVESRKNRRVLYYGAGMGGLSFSRKSLRERKFVVPSETSRTSAGVVLTPTEDLPDGEYALLAGMQLYSFGIGGS